MRLAGRIPPTNQKQPVPVYSLTAKKCEETCYSDFTSSSLIYNAIYSTDVTSEAGSGRDPCDANLLTANNIKKKESASNQINSFSSSETSQMKMFTCLSPCLWWVAVATAVSDANLLIRSPANNFHTFSANRDS